jgi:hypothetical protein
MHFGFNNGGFKLPSLHRKQKPVAAAIAQQNKPTQTTHANSSIPAANLSKPNTDPFKTNRTIAYQLSQHSDILLSLLSKHDDYNDNDNDNKKTEANNKHDNLSPQHYNNMFLGAFKSLSSEKATLEQIPEHQQTNSDKERIKFLESTTFNMKPEAFKIAHDRLGAIEDKKIAEEFHPNNAAAERKQQQSMLAKMPPSIKPQPTPKKNTTAAQLSTQQPTLSKMPSSSTITASPASTPNTSSSSVNNTQAYQTGVNPRLKSLKRQGQSVMNQRSELIDAQYEILSKPALHSADQSKLADIKTKLKFNDAASEYIRSEMANIEKLK